MRTQCKTIVRLCREEIDAAIAAHNSTVPVRRGLPPEAARLLTVMFSEDDVCQRPVGSLAAEGFDHQTAIRLLSALIGAGFVARDHPGRGRGRASIYHLHLPPLVRR
jgi:hypothetical protein